jgi:hypothetical protein
MFSRIARNCVILIATQCLPGGYNVNQIRINQIILAVMVLVIGIFFLHLIPLLAKTIIAAAAVAVIYEVWQLVSRKS